MGTLNVNTLKSETLTGKSVASSIAVTAEGGSITTNLQQGLVKCWCYWETTDTVRDSFNSSGLTDNGTGDATYSYTNNMANAIYHTPFSGWDSTSFMTTSQGYNKTSTFWNNAHSGGDFSTAVDASEKGETSLGDLA